MIRVCGRLRTKLMGELEKKKFSAHRAACSVSLPFAVAACSLSAPKTAIVRNCLTENRLTKILSALNGIHNAQTHLRRLEQQQSQEQNMCQQSCCLHPHKRYFACAAACNAHCLLDEAKEILFPWRSSATNIN